MKAGRSKVYSSAFIYSAFILFFSKGELYVVANFWTESFCLFKINELVLCASTSFDLPQNLVPRLVSSITFVHALTIYYGRFY